MKTQLEITNEKKNLNTIDFRMDKTQSVVTHVSDDSDALEVFIFSVHFRRPLRVAMKESVTWNLWKRPCLQKYNLILHMTNGG